MIDAFTKRDLLARLAGRPVLKEVVRRRMRLIRAGHRWKAPCPFHLEKTPSFYVGNWWFVCYGCGAEGNVIDFVQRHDGLSEKEAIQHVALEFGIDIAGLESPSAVMSPRFPTAQRVIGSDRRGFEADLASSVSEFEDLIPF